MKGMGLKSPAQPPNHACEEKHTDNRHQPNRRDKRCGKQSKPGDKRRGRALLFAVDNAPATDGPPQQRSVQEGRVKHTPIMAKIARLVRQGVCYGAAL